MSVYVKLTLSRRDAKFARKKSWPQNFCSPSCETRRKMLNHLIFMDFFTTCYNFVEEPKLHNFRPSSQFYVRELEEKSNKFIFFTV